MIRSTLTLLFAAICCFCSQAQTQKEVAEGFLQALKNKDFEKAAAAFDPKITQINKDVLELVWTQLNTAFGKYQSHRITGKETTGLAAIMEFERDTKAFGLTFNEQNLLMGFVLLPAAPAENETETTTRFRDDTVSVQVKGGILKGSIMWPDNKVAAPRMALIIAGSGPTDRNGNSPLIGRSDSYRMLAELLAELGIASLRYDKRGIAASNGFDMDESKLTFDDMVDDAVSLVQYLRNEHKAASVIVIGHSEGSHIGMLTAQKGGVDQFISICGAGEAISQTLKRQIPDPAAHKILDELQAGRTVSEIPTGMESLFRPAIQPYMISWMKTNPAEIIKQLKMPVLIIGGTHDIQVPAADAEMLKKSAPDASLLIVEGMSHIMKDGPEDRAANIASYNQPDLPLSTALKEGISQFLTGK
jgi:pimeloyl-ACP methyl ester carboxylesterase